MPIRPETPADREAIARIHREAFADHPYSRQTEHLIVEALREAGALVVSLVAEVDDGVPAGHVVGHVAEHVVGHVACSRALVDGRDLGWHLLGPVGVLPEHQRKGLGSALVLAALAALRGLGSQGCALVGDPAFYSRLGFRLARSLTYPGVPPEVILCLPLAGEEPQGALGHHPAFEVEP